MGALMDWNALSAIANLVTAAGVFAAIWQLRITKVIAQLQFEDSLEKEYRDLAARIPTKVFFGAELNDSEYESARDEFYRYVDLSNVQVSLRIRGRISEMTWESWCEGIEFNLRLPAFEKAWIEIKEQTTTFQELRTLEKSGFSPNPRNWR
ncbi:MAG: hypothetical protein V4562_07325 [Pseudomonadota bacterium]